MILIKMCPVALRWTVTGGGLLAVFLVVLLLCGSDVAPTALCWLSSEDNIWYTVMVTTAILIARCCSVQSNTVCAS